MKMPVMLPVAASLANPRDPAEVTLIADVVSVGQTLPTKDNHILHFTDEFLARHAKDLVGKPVNIEIVDGQATGHSQNVVGSITSAAYNAITQKVGITASLWRHYYPETVRKVVELFGNGDLETSVEVLLDEYESEESEEGLHLTPKNGVFTGLGMVQRGADPRNRILALAEAYEEDASALSSVKEFEIDPSVTTSSTTSAVITWFSGQSSDESEEADSASRKDVDNMEEAGMPPTTVLAESAEEASATEQAPVDDQEKDQGPDWKAKFEELSAKVAADEAKREAEARVSERLTELEKIAPTTSEQREQYSKLLGNMDDGAYDAMKQILLSAVTPALGISSDAEVEPLDEDTDPGEAVIRENLDKWRKEALEAYGQPQSRE